MFAPTRCDRNVTNDNKQTNGLAEMAQSARQWANILAVKGLLTGPPESFAGRGDQTNNNLMECLLTDLSLLEVPKNILSKSNEWL